MAKTARMELRLHPDDDALIRRAANERHESVNVFVARAARAAAEEVVIERSMAFLDPEEYDELLHRMDEPPSPNHRLAALLDSTPPWADGRAASEA